MYNSSQNIKQAAHKSWAYLYERALQEANLRALLLLLMFFVGVVIVIGRAGWLQLVNAKYYITEAEKRYLRFEEVRGKRGIIKDSRGNPLAMSEVFARIEASPQVFKEVTKKAKADVYKDYQERIIKLAKFLNKSEDDIVRTLKSNNGYVILASDLTPQLAEENIRGIPGLNVKIYYKRLYPTGAVNSRLLGLTDSDDNGQEGLEKFYDLRLQDKVGLKRTIYDNGKNIIEVEDVKKVHNGESISLSIDNRIQQYAYTVLRESVIATNAKEAALVMLDTVTGEVVAMVGYPSFDPNNRSKLDRRYMRNIVVNDIFEPGSTIKPFFAALALEKGVVNKNQIFDVSKEMKVSGKEINDSSQHQKLSLSEVIQFSSNRGIVQATEKLTRKESWEMLNKLGFGEVLPISLPGSVPGVLRDYKNWYPLDKATITFGHTMSASLLQLVRAYTVFTRGGYVIQPTLLKSDNRVIGREVFSDKVTAQVVQMLIDTVEKGSGKKGQIPEYSVAGKTGTAKKFVGGKYANKYIATFVGFAPASDPRLLTAVMINEPANDNEQYYGGSVAAPVFAKVMANALRLRNIKPDLANNNKVVAKAKEN